MDANRPLHQLLVSAGGQSIATSYGVQLLSDLGARTVSGTGLSVDQTLLGPPGSASEHWAESGALGLTGHRHGPALDPHTQVASRMHGASAAARLLAGKLGAELVLDGPALLAERSACNGFARRGARSMGGACQLLRCADGWLAVNLPRSEDLELVPAWLRDESVDPESWDEIAGRLHYRSAKTLLADAQVLGLAVAPVPGPAALPDRAAPLRSPFRISRPGAPIIPRRGTRPPLVIDLTTLWAGPLCGQLLTEVGAQVVKVESPARPDGARRGSRQFFDLLNHNKMCISLDPRQPADREQLRLLISRADLVLESFRPQVMPRLGLAPAAMLAQNPGLSWVAISAYGRTGPHAGNPGYGDDIAAAGGFLTHDGTGQPLFCADAAADPMTGLHALVAALSCLEGNGGHLIDVSMYDVVRRMTSGDLHWNDRAGAPWTAPITPPRARNCGRAADLGADTQRVLKDLAAA